MKKENKHFNHAYKEHFGKEWKWKTTEGKPNHPMDNGTEVDKAFYVGFLYAKRGHKFLRDIIKEYELLKRDIKNLESRLEKLTRL